MNKDKALANKRKRTRGERELDLTMVAQLYIRGTALSKITEQINDNRAYKMSLSQITDDLYEIRKRWLDSYLGDFDEHRAKELARLDELEHAYWNEYELSKKPLTETLEEKVKVDGAARDGSLAAGEGVGTGSSVKQRARRKTTERDANLETLRGIERCIELRCRVLGLHAPTTLNINWRKQAQQAGYDPEEILEGIVQDLVDKMPPQEAIQSGLALMAGNQGDHGDQGNHGGG